MMLSSGLMVTQLNQGAQEGHKAMTFHPPERATKFLPTSFEKLSEREQHILHHIAQRLHISGDTTRVLESTDAAAG